MKINLKLVGGGLYMSAAMLVIFVPQLGGVAVMLAFVAGMAWHASIAHNLMEAGGKLMAEMHNELLRCMRERADKIGTGPDGDPSDARRRG